MTKSVVPDTAWHLRLLLSACLTAVVLVLPAHSQGLEIVEVEGQPLAANIQRLLTALSFLGAALPTEIASALKLAAEGRDPRRLQELLDRHVLVVVSVNPKPASGSLAAQPGRSSNRQATHPC
jgi:hypothetical protein